MSIPQTANNIVWSRARGLCSICRHDLVDKIGGDPKITGERAHISAAKPGGPRYDPELSSEERNSYPNLMLLCALCHSKVDVAPEHFTTAKLHAIKAEHEAYCARLLTVDDERRAISGEILANAIDLIVHGLSLERWDEWTSQALGPGTYRLPKWWYRDFRIELRPRVEAVLWPKTAHSLAIAAKMSADAVIAFFSTFSEFTPSRNWTIDDEYLTCDSIEMMLGEYFGGDYDAYEKRLFEWDETLELGLVHLTKCVNWFADAVRETVNPRFRILEGGFVIEPCRFDGGSYGFYTFTEEEKNRILDHGYVKPSRADVWMIVQGAWLEPPERTSDIGGST